MYKHSLQYLQFQILRRIISIPYRIRTVTCNASLEALFLYNQNLKCNPQLRATSRNRTKPNIV